jgi:hypothetical protein
MMRKPRVRRTSEDRGAFAAQLTEWKKKAATVELPTEGPPSEIEVLKATPDMYRDRRFTNEDMQVTPELADAWMKRNESNRPFRISTSNRYAAVMAAGRWRQPPTAESIKFDRDGLLRDGQHRLSAVVKAGVPVRFCIAFGCDPEEWKVYDQGLARTASDILHQYGIPSQKQSAALAYMILRIEQDDPHKIDRLMVTERANDLYTSDPIFAASVRAGAQSAKLSTPSAMGLAYWTIAHKTSRPDKLDAFWNDISSGANLQLRSPELKLREWLVESRGASGTARDVATRRAAAVILAWNALLDHRSPRNFVWNFTTRLPEVR